MRLAIAPALVLVGLLAPPAQARIKLAALPARQRVEIQLDHGRYTLVEEERIVPLLQSTPARGNNRIDFSWSNTQIDKDSIQFRPLAIRVGGEFKPIGKVSGEGGNDEVSVINVAYPPNENALVWEVFSAEPCAVKVRVSYLISNLTRSFAYRALADKDETTLTLKKYIQLRNYSGEDFGSAGVWAGFGPAFLKPVGMSEDIKMLLRRFDGVKIRKSFTFDWFAHGPLNNDKPLASRVLMHYELVNDEDHGLGAFPLQGGKVRIFIDDGRGGEAFLGEDWARLTPLEDKMRLYLGEARDVACTRIVKSDKRHPIKGNLFDRELVIRYEIENFKDTPCTLDIVEQINRIAGEGQYGRHPHGDAEWELGEQTSDEIEIAYDDGHATPKLSVELPARPADKDADVKKVIVTFHFTIKNLW